MIGLERLNIVEEEEKKGGTQPTYGIHFAFATVATIIWFAAINMYTN
jgi:hypothetical protein